MMQMGDASVRMPVSLLRHSIRGVWGTCRSVDEDLAPRKGPAPVSSEGVEGGRIHGSDSE